MVADKTTGFAVTGWLIAKALVNIQNTSRRILTSPQPIPVAPRRTSLSLTQRVWCRARVRSESSGADLNLGATSGRLQSLRRDYYNGKHFEACFKTKNITTDLRSRLKQFG